MLLCIVMVVMVIVVWLWTIATLRFLEALTPQINTGNKTIENINCHGNDVA